MAFDARIIVINKPLSALASIEQAVLDAADLVLASFKIHVAGTISADEYEKNSSSREISKYIRVRKRDLLAQKTDAEAQYEMLKVGSGSYSVERFASAKIAFVSVSAMEDRTVLWYNFHSRLAKVLPGFGNFHPGIAEYLSARYHCEAMVLGATSFSRNDDLFAFYAWGKVRNKLSGKAALTDVKTTYGVDINQCMNNIDENMAILYAPRDYQEVKADMAEQTARYESLKAQAEATPVTDKQDGHNLMETFTAENEAIMANLQDRYALVKRALMTDPIGKVIFFRIDDGLRQAEVAPSLEREFGRDPGAPPARSDRGSSDRPGGRAPSPAPRRSHP